MIKDKDILFVAGDLGVGGAQMHLVDLVNHLDAHIHPAIFILNNQDALAGKIKPSVQIHKVLRHWRFDTSPANIIAEQITTKNFSSFFAINLFAFVFLALARKRSKLDFPINVIVHTTQVRGLTDFLRLIGFSRLRRPQDKFISVCQAQARYFAEHYFVARDSFLTIYNGVDTARFIVRPSSFNADQFRELWGIPSNSKVIVQVATFRKEKRHQDSVEALLLMHLNGAENVYLLFVGGGNESIESGLRALVRKANLDKYVKFCGMQEDVRPFYWISDCFTLSSDAIETFSISALEAMASGLPCVITDLGGAREMVTDVENGFVVPIRNPKALAEGWQKVLNGVLSLDQNAIREIVTRRFSMESMVRSYETLIN